MNLRGCIHRKAKDEQEIQPIGLSLNTRVRQASL